MPKRLIYMLTGFVMIVVSVYLLYDIIEALPKVSDSKPQTGSMPDATGDWYLAKLFGSLLVACMGLVVVIINIIRLIGDQKEKE